MMVSPPDAVLRVVSTLRDAGHQAWLVGGCVRDRLAERSVNDWDVATEAEPEEVLTLFPKVVATGLQHGTVTVVDDHMPIEVTTFRIEKGYSDGRRPDEVEFTDDLHADLARRDFTINAIAWDPVDDRLEDPFSGREDLEAGVLRAVGDPVERFDEDGLRPMRAVRFACALNLKIDPPTRAAIPATLATFGQVAVERVQVEFRKTLLAERAAWGLRTLRETGLLAGFLPEVASLTAEQWALLEAALDPPPPGLEARLAVLLHDCEPPGDAPLQRLRFSNAERARAVRLLAFRDLDPAAPRTDAEVRALVAGVGVDVLDDLLAYRAARARTDAAEAAAWRAFAERIEQIGARAAPHAPKDLAIDGRTVMQLLDERPSRRIGQVLEALLREVWADPSLNTPEALRARVPAVAAALSSDGDVGG